MRVVFAGTPEAALPSLAALLDAGHDVVAVVTNPDAPAGRGRRQLPSPVAAFAAERGIPVLAPERARDPEFQAALTALAPEVCPVVAWGRLIPDALLDVPVFGWINLHFSLLPAWRGAAPVQRCLMAGDTRTGVTTFRIVHDLDAGPAFRQVITSIDPAETAGDLLTRLAVLGAGVLVDTLADLASGVPPEPQPDHGITLAPKVTVDDARIDWTAPAATVVNLARGVTPAPGAWTTLGGERLKLPQVQVVDEGSLPASLAPGELWADKRRLLAGTGSGPVELVRVQASGKSVMDGVAWARGARPTPGTCCV